MKRSLLFLTLIAYTLPFYGEPLPKRPYRSTRINPLNQEEPTFEKPTSQLATQNQFYSPDFKFWCEELSERFKMHRKLWEFCYVCQVLKQTNMLQDGKKGLGFGVGTEPLPALFAKYGCHIVASDQDFESAKKQGWVHTDQYMTEKTKLNKKSLCDQVLFDQRVELKSVDMNHIDKDLQGFDFVWSCCALEHLGSLKAGLDFIINSINCLKPGGIAVHTTEFNLSSNGETIESPGLSIYRRRDIIGLINQLTALGYNVAPVNFHRGTGPLDAHVDLPPYKLYEDYQTEVHLRLKLGKFDCTSIGLIVTK